MKKSKYLYFTTIFLVTLLTYEQSLGLNALLIPVLIVGVTYFSNPSIISLKWLLGGSLWILSGLGIFLWQLDIGLPLFLITGFHYFSISFHSQISLPISLLQTSISFFTGIIRFFNIKLNVADIKSIGTSSQKLLRKFLLIAIPIMVFIIFLKLYQTANPEFEKLTAFINFNFIEIPFFLQLGILSVFCFGLFFFKPNQKILEVDLEKNYSVTNETVSHSSFIQFEWQLGLITVSILSLLLLLFITVDFQTIFGNLESELNHSQQVHQGINVLIVSIILVIIITLYFFRGHLNFKPSNALKFLTYFWLFLNTILIILIIIRNNQYIASWGLTHKRIGVYIYLSLCIIGLLFTATKIKVQWSTAFLIEYVSSTFLTILVLYGLFNWNGLIAKYNLDEKNLSSEKIDFYYLSELGSETYVPIINYLNNHPDSGYSVESLLGYKIFGLNSAYSKDWSFFLSYTYSGYKAYQTTKAYNYKFRGSTINF